MKKQMTSFVEFIREQGVVGLAIGFVLGGSVNSVVKSLVTDIIEPIIGMFFGSTDGLASWAIGPVMLGNFIVALIDFIILAAVVFFVFKGLGFESLDKKKDK
jgi:large conductance mechanosensitive channel